jgi:NAD+ synthetase
MKLATAQINCLLGDLPGNITKIVQYAEQAKQQGARLLLTPELSLCGYPPEDLLLRDGFYRACAAALLELASKVSGIAVVVGHPHEEEGKRYNAASLLQNGKVVLTYFKQRLPNYAVFDEARYFQQGNQPEVFEIEGVSFGLAICADVWKPDVALQAREAGAQVLLVLNASPYAVQKENARHQVIAERVAESGLSVVYANMVGGQDELVFDGGSFAMDSRGEVSAQAVHFQEALLMLNIEEDGYPKGEKSELLSDDASVYQALCLGVHDYVTKNRFPGVLLGLSGGIDSALTLAVAVDALGADKVHAVMMPSPYTAQISLDDSREMANILGIRYDEFSIESLFRGYLGTLEATFSGHDADATEENLQARIRATLLMALSNKFGSLVLTTGNKSEMSVGYATLYGDMAGGFSVLKDVRKMLVYRLSRYRNTLGQVIPERIITRAPSAELRDNQTDQDSLPEYEVLDAIVTHYVENNLSILEIVALGFSEEDVRKVVQMTRRSEYKRRQSAVGVRITERSYGKDWRYPITTRYQDDY